MKTKTLFIGITLLLTVVLTIIFAVDSMNTWAYAFGGKLSPSVYITPVVGVIISMMFSMMPDESNKEP